MWEWRLSHGPREKCLFRALCNRREGTLGTAAFYVKAEPCSQIITGLPRGSLGFWVQELAPSLVKNVTSSKGGSGRGGGALGAGTLLP